MQQKQGEETCSSIGLRTSVEILLIDEERLVLESGQSLKGKKSWMVLIKNAD